MTRGIMMMMHACTRMALRDVFPVKLNAVKESTLGKSEYKCSRRTERRVDS